MKVSLRVFAEQAAIVAFMDTRFERITSTQRALHLLRKFENLKLPNLGIQEKYQRILLHYSRDIEMVSRTYQKNKSDPPVARDLPPVAGKIAWSRQLFRRIQEPMEVFQQHQVILQTPEAKKIIKNFNKLAKVLLEFELLYHRGWLRQVKRMFSRGCWLLFFSFLCCCFVYIVCFVAVNSCLFRCC